MDHSYAESKLTSVVRDLNQYTADEFRRQMARIISGATGQDVPDDCHIIKAERDALAKEVDAANDRNAELVEERDALAARVKTAERVEKIFSEIPELKFDDCLKLFADEIRDVKAEAGRKGFISGANWFWLNWVHKGINLVEDDKVNAAKEYAVKLRQGGAA